ncbi:MAG: LCP family protein [Eubacterium sp.]|nr:LCP family protein [Eubacterium sp.]
MKRQIDPNLSGFGEDDIISSVGADDNVKEVLKKEPELPKVEKTEQNAELKADVKSYSEAMLLAQKEKEEEEKAKAHRHHRHHHHHHRSSSKSSGSHHSSTSKSSGSHSHHHHHHHSSSKSKKSKKKLPLALKIAIIILLILALMVTGVFGTFLVLKNRGKKDIMPEVTEQAKYEEIIEYNGHKYKFNEDVVALAFLGVDQREIKSADETDFVGCTDADIVIAVDTNTGKTNVIAIPRDTMVDVDVYSESGVLLKTHQAQLCLAYAYGDGEEKSCNNAVEAMSRILNNVPIQKYFALDLDGIAPLNDAIGGVEISSSLYKFDDYGVDIGDPVKLEGDMAEAYVRRRDDDYLEASLNRTDRQIQYVKAFAQQALPAVVRDFSTVSKLYRTAQNYSQTNLSLSNATYISSLLLSKNISNFDTITLKGEMKSSKAPLIPEAVYAEFYPDEDSVTEAVLKAFYTQID